jgi:hypothetical protein
MTFTRSGAVDRRFKLLSSRWKAEVGMISSVTELARHRDYVEIVRMGWPAVPLILRELQKSPDHWFPALQQITGANPVSQNDRGRVKAMAQAWIRWGRENGLIG